MKTEKLTISEYAKLRGISRQAVLKAIKNSRELPNISKIERLGKFYMLTFKPEK